MKIYKKWFLVDINDKDNPRSLFAFVNENMKPKGKNPFYELNGIRYNVVSKSEWTTEKGAVRRSSHQTICQQPLPEITCCYLLYGMGNKKWFEFYKGDEKIKEIFSASYFDALAEFMEWYKNYA